MSESFQYFCTRIFISLCVKIVPARVLQLQEEYELNSIFIISYTSGLESTDCLCLNSSQLWMPPWCSGNSLLPVDEVFIGRTLLFCSDGKPYQCFLDAVPSQRGTQYHHQYHLHLTFSSSFVGTISYLAWLLAWIFDSLLRSTNGNGWRRWGYLDNLDNNRVMKSSKTELVSLRSETEGNLVRCMLDSIGSCLPSCLFVFCCLCCCSYVWLVPPMLWMKFWCNISFYLLAWRVRIMYIVSTWRSETQKLLDSSFFSVHNLSFILAQQDAI